MNSFLRASALVASMAALSACSTITRGTTEAFVVESDPVGVEVRLSTGQTCKTPCSLEVKRRPGFTVYLTKEGYEPVEANITSQVSGGGAAAMAGNVLVGGFIGAAIDAGTGSMNELKPNPLVVRMVKSPSA